MNPEEESIIKLSPSRISGLEAQYLNEALEKNELSYHGNFISYVENYFKNYFNGKKSVALNSGTSAIHLALIMAGVKKEDEVLCQTFTYAATAFPINYVGARPVFIDSEMDSWNMCPKTLNQAIKSRIQAGKRPKAIIVVHSYGMPCKIEDIAKIAHTYNIPLIEDAAEAIGSSINGKKCGSFGTYGILSFNTNKMITASGGGLLICNSEKEKARIIQLATQAKAKKTYYHHNAIGFNYRMNNINAAILKAQLSILEDNLTRKREIHDFYIGAFERNESIRLQEEYSNGVMSNIWLNCILVNDNNTRNNLEKSLLKANIETRPLWKPMHLQPIFKASLYFGKSISEKLFEKGMCLPSGSSLTNNQLIRIGDIISSVIQSKKT